MKRKRADSKTAGKAADVSDLTATTSSALSVDPGCGGASLWIYDGFNRSGNQTCLSGRGKEDLNSLCAQTATGFDPLGRQFVYCAKWWFSGGVSQVRSYWPGTDDGSMLGIPTGECTQTCSSWTTWGAAVDTLYCYSGTGRWIELGVWGKACWMNSSNYSLSYESPDGSDTGWDWANGNQGIAHDNDNYYLTNLQGVFQSPKWVTLARDINSSYSYPVGYKHYGDADAFGGRLFVPLEEPVSGSAGPAVMRLTLPNLTLENVATIPGAQGAPWVAMNPRNGKLYTSNFGDAGITSIRHGVWSTTAPFSLAMLPDIPLRWRDGTAASIKRVQGGAFSTNGHLYLLSDDRDPAWGGIYGVDVESGTVHVRIPISYTPTWTSGVFDGDELEGITVDPNGSFYSGHIHVTIPDRDSTNNDDMRVSHFVISDVSKL